MNTPAPVNGTIPSQKGPLHISPVNWAGSVSEISPRPCTLFFVKISMCSYDRPGWPRYRDLGFCDRDLGNRDENFPCEHSSPVSGMKHFRQRASSYEPGNRAGSVTGTNSVVCSVGNFSPVDRDEFMRKHNQNGGT